jgi:pantoate--beta-alanine ligase
MRILETAQAFRQWRSEVPARTSIGLVPTMGALHEGHESLFRRARKENDVAIATIFVNPTQFDHAEDLEKYPKTLQKDVEMLERVGMDAVFIPRSKDELYPDAYQYRVSENDFSKVLCGAHRPGHFEGMLTVVLKLLNLARADRAYFGEKDYQQLTLIRGMAEAFFLSTEIVGCPTVREFDGLAKSSRNVRLSKDERMEAPALYAAMTEEKDVLKARARIERAGFEVDYLEDVSLPNGESRRFAAASLGSVRLIDNVPLRRE